MLEALQPTQEPGWVLSHEGYNVLTESTVESRFAFGNGFLLKSREFGRSPFKRLKVFIAFKEPSAKLDWRPSPHHYFAAEPESFEGPGESRIHVEPLQNLRVGPDGVEPRLRRSSRQPRPARWRSRPAPANRRI